VTVVAFLAILFTGRYWRAIWLAACRAAGMHLG
jgi:hypothetical protein